MQPETKNDIGSRPVRVGIAGIGRAAIFEHIPELQSMPGKFKIAAVCDLMKFRRDIILSSCPDAKPYRRVEDMLDDPEIDLVDICTRTQDHVKHAMAALKRDKWTVLESPMATSHADALSLRAESVRARNRLIVRQTGAFAPDFLLARKMLGDRRLGDIYEASVESRDFLRRDDWQSVKKCGGGIRFYALPDMMLQALALLGSPPVKMWAELKHVVSLGDAEDYARIILRSRTQRSVCITASGASLAPPGPSFAVSGTRGRFTVMRGSAEGTLRMLDPERDLPRRRCSVRTPPLDDMREDLDIVEVPVSLTPEEKARSGNAAFWDAVYATMRFATPFPATIDDSIEVLRLIDLSARAAK